MSYHDWVTLAGDVLALIAAGWAHVRISKGGPGGG